MHVIPVCVTFQKSTTFAYRLLGLSEIHARQLRNLKTPSHLLGLFHNHFGAYFVLSCVALLTAPPLERQGGERLGRASLHPSF